MTQQTWHIFVCLAAMCFSVGAWLIPCLLLYRQPSKYFRVDECQNLKTEERTDKWRLDSFNSYLTQGIQHFLAYERNATQTLLVDRYAVFFDTNKHSANVVGLAGEFNMKNISCSVLVACGPEAMETKQTGETFYQSCHLPYSVNGFRAIGVVARCGSNIDVFFWVEGKGAWTKMLRSKGHLFVCSEFASCPYDVIPEVAEEFNFLETESGCGTRVFSLKQELPLWIKAQGSL